MPPDSRICIGLSEVFLNPTPWLPEWKNSSGDDNTNIIINDLEVTEGDWQRDRRLCTGQFRLWCRDIRRSIISPSWVWLYPGGHIGKCLYSSDPTTKGSPACPITHGQRKTQQRICVCMEVTKIKKRGGWSTIIASNVKLQVQSEHKCVKKGRAVKLYLYSVVMYSICGQRLYNAHITVRSKKTDMQGYRKHRLDKNWETLALHTLTLQWLGLWTAHWAFCNALWPDLHCKTVQ